MCILHCALVTWAAAWAAGWAAGQRGQARGQPAGSAAFKHGPVGRPVAGATPTGAVKVASQAWGIAGRIGWQPRQAGGAAA